MKTDFKGFKLALYCKVEEMKKSSIFFGLVNAFANTIALKLSLKTCFYVTETQLLVWRMFHSLVNSGKTLLTGSMLPG